MGQQAKGYSYERGTKGDSDKEASDGEILSGNMSVWAYLFSQTFESLWV